MAIQRVRIAEEVFRRHEIPVEEGRVLASPEHIQNELTCDRYLDAGAVRLLWGISHVLEERSIAFSIDVGRNDRDADTDPAFTLHCSINERDGAPPSTESWSIDFPTRSTESFFVDLERDFPSGSTLNDAQALAITERVAAYFTGQMKAITV